MKTKIIIVTITQCIVFLFGFLSIEIFKDYGWVVFVLNPIVIGFIPSYYASKILKTSKDANYSLSFITLLVSILLLVTFAIEGIICIAMALPIFLLLTWFGAYLGNLLYKSNKLNDKSIALLFMLTSIAFFGFDSKNNTELIAVKTKITINSPIEKVWKNVITFDTISKPNELIFKTGIAYPTNATIKGSGVGAIRYCNFTTGSFVEPITIWNKPNLLAFSVKSQPIPMNEYNPFWNIRPPHLNGYFKSYKGQFKLTKITNEQTELEGTTWYKVDIYPQFYWKIWSDEIIHRIHNRVLNHIKYQSEK